MANYMQKVAEMLGVEIGEHFRIKNGDGRTVPFIYKLTGNGLMFSEAEQQKVWERSTSINGLLTGEYTIVTLPWRPKKGENYYLIADDFKSLISLEWTNAVYDYMCLYTGNCFRTKQEATAARDSGELMAKLRKYYDEYGGEE